MCGVQVHVTFQYICVLEYGCTLQFVSQSNWIFQENKVSGRLHGSEEEGSGRKRDGHENNKATHLYVGLKKVL